MLHYNIIVCVKEGVGAVYANQKDCPLTTAQIELLTNALHKDIDAQIEREREVIKRRLT